MSLKDKRNPYQIFYIRVRDFHRFAKLRGNYASNADMMTALLDAWEAHHGSILPTVSTTDLQEIEAVKEAFGDSGEELTGIITTN